MRVVSDAERRARLAERPALGEVLTALQSVSEELHHGNDNHPVVRRRLAVAGASALAVLTVLGVAAVSLRDQLTAPWGWTYHPVAAKLTSGTPSLPTIDPGDCKSAVDYLSLQLTSGADFGIPATEFQIFSESFERYRKDMEEQKPDACSNMYALYTVMQSTAEDGG